MTHPSPAGSQQGQTCPHAVHHGGICAPCSLEQQRRGLEALVDDVFSYHTPTLEQVQAMQEIREKARELAKVLIHRAPSCADRSAAIRKLRECVMTVNAAIVLGGKTL